MAELSEEHPNGFFPEFFFSFERNNFDWMCERELNWDWSLYECVFKFRAKWNAFDDYLKSISHVHKGIEKVVVILLSFAVIATDQPYHLHIQPIKRNIDDDDDDDDDGEREKKVYTFLEFTCCSTEKQQ